MTSEPQPRIERAALGMLAAWMGERFFRTFRVAPDAERGPFDAMLTQREHRVGVTVGILWDDAQLPGVDTLQAQVSADIERATVCWALGSDSLYAYQSLSRGSRLSRMALT